MICLGCLHCSRRLMIDPRILGGPNYTDFRPLNNFRFQKGHKAIRIRFHFHLHSHFKCENNLILINIK